MTVMVRKNIVLLHGWGANVEKLGPLAQELRKLDWKVYIPRIPGFDTSPPKNVWGLMEYSKFILKSSYEVFKREKFFVFGHSFGGRIALKLASQNPNRLGGIVLCSSAGISRGNPIKRYVFQALAKIGKLLNIFPLPASFWKRVLYKLAREHDYEKTDGIMREVFKKVVAEDLKRVLVAIHLPVLILWGREDKLTPVVDAYFMKNVIAHSQLFIYENEGHKLPYSRPKEVAGKIDKWITTLV